MPLNNDKLRIAYSHAVSGNVPKAFDELGEVVESLMADIRKLHAKVNQLENRRP